MIRSIRQRLNSEGGFTLIEVMAALIVLTVAMTGLAGAVIGGIRATQVAQYRSGKEGVFNFLVGMVMKETKGKANPQVATELLKKKLSGGGAG